MTLRVRLTLLLTSIVLVTVLGAWWFTGRTVLAPFAKQVMRAHVDQVVYIADELEKGADPRRVSARLGLDVRLFERAPHFVRRAREQPDRRCRIEQIREREVVICRGPKAPVATETTRGWVVVRRDLDDAAPERRMGFTLLAVALVVILLASWVATLALRPLRHSIRAMERMAKGDVTHRLPEAGSKEVGEVARAFNSMADRIDRFLRAERELMAGISHELRTPLARLRLELELLRDREVPEKRIDAMEADLAEMDRLIGELLQLSRLSIGERRLEPQDLDLARVVADAIERQPLPDHRVEVSGEAATVRGDHEQLVRVMTNLLQNAGKYAPPGTTVHVALHERTVEVADGGPGVPAEDLERLFEPFYRGARGKLSGATGLGLGLMIARQVISLHGGRIEAANAPEGGLIIRFTLPSPGELEG